MGDIACGERSRGSGDPVKGLCDVRGDPRPASTQSQNLSSHRFHRKTEKERVRERGREGGRERKRERERERDYARCAQCQPHSSQSKHIYDRAINEESGKLSVS